MSSAKGVITNKVIRMTTRPVLAVSAAQSNIDEVGLHKILVATDFPEHSKRVVEYAFDLKRIFVATIYMLYVIETGPCDRLGHSPGPLRSLLAKTSTPILTIKL